jgi:hypothetical protein
MFTDNKYTTCYYRIISNARNRITEGYTEHNRFREPQISDDIFALGHIKPSVDQQDDR